MGPSGTVLRLRTRSEGSRRQGRTTIHIPAVDDPRPRLTGQLQDAVEALAAGFGVPVEEILEPLADSINRSRGTCCITADVVRAWLGGASFPGPAAAVVLDLVRAQVWRTARSTPA